MFCMEDGGGVRASVTNRKNINVLKDASKKISVTIASREKMLIRERSKRTMLHFYSTFSFIGFN